MIISINKCVKNVLVLALKLKCKHQKNCHLLFSSLSCMQKVQNIQKLSSCLFFAQKKCKNAKNNHFLFSHMFYLHTKSAKKCQKLPSSLLFSCLPAKSAKCKSWKNFIYLLFAHKKCKTWSIIFHFYPSFLFSKWKQWNLEFLIEHELIF